MQDKEYYDADDAVVSIDRETGEPYTTNANGSRTYGSEF